jgi:hypothetical protein
MPAENARQRLLSLSGALLLVALVVLSLPQMFFEPLTLLYRTANQGLLILGALGSVWRNKSLRFAGWIGICMLFLYAVFGSLPSVDHPVFDSLDGHRRPQIWIWRPILALLLYILLVGCYRKLILKPQPR